MKSLLIIALAALVVACSAAPVRIVCLGDSITRGARSGVTEAQTYEALLQDWLSEKVVPVEVVNVGIGGERTDQAIVRLAADVVAKNPAVVTIMYGTNDSAIDEGKSTSRLPLETYEQNLHLMVDRLRAAGIKPVLMTSPPLGQTFGYMRWSPYKDNGPNFRIIDYVRAARTVAGDEAVPLVDNFATWAEAAFMGTDIDTLMTDGCHPNPAGHELIAHTMFPVLARMLGGPSAPPPPAPVAPAQPVADTTAAPPADGNLALRKTYTETSRNEFGYADGLTDGIKNTDGRGGVYATGKDDKYPKITTIDLGQAEDVGRIIVHNSRDGDTKNVVLSISTDGEQFTEVGRHEFQQGDGYIYECKFEPAKARYVQITFVDSWLVELHGSPDFMFIREVEVFAK